jgi:acyl-CoA synthetase (NDP forming)
VSSTISTPEIGTRDDAAQERRMNALFAPSSVAVVGVSTEPSGPGARVFRNLLAFFDGPVGGINRRAPIIDGHQTVADLAGLDFVPDLIVVATPAETVAEVMEQAGLLGVRAAIVLTAGFAEAGPEGLMAQQRLVEIAAAHDMVVLGPNSVGLMSRPNGLFATFTNAVAEPNPGGGVAIVAQSGGMAAIVYTILSSFGVGVDHLVALGNGAATTLGEVVGHLVRPGSGVSTVLCFAEALSGWDDLAAAAVEASHSDKLIAVCRAGRSEVGATAASSHVGAIAGDDLVLSQLVRTYGIVEAASLDDLVDIAKARHAAGPMRGPRVGIVTASGGAGSLLADLITEACLTVPVLSDPLQRRVFEVIPWFGSATNPVDTTAYVQTRPEAFSDVAELLCASGELNAVVVFLGTLDPIAERLVAGLSKVAADHTDVPLIAVWGGGSRKYKTALWQAGVATYDDPSRGIRGVASLYRAPLQLETPIAPGPSVAVVDDYLAPGRDRAVLGEDAVRRLLVEEGLPVVPGGLARSVDEAVAMAATLTEPLVLKLIADEVEHKSDVGGVILNVRGMDEVRARAVDLFALAEQLGVQAVGVLVEQNMPAGLELLCAVRRDANAGPIVVIGLGGVLAEIVGSVAVRPAGAGPDAMLAALRSLFEGRLLNHHRGIPPERQREVAELASHLGELALRLPWLTELECNPVIVGPFGLAICDGLATVSRPAEAS